MKGNKVAVVLGLACFHVGIIESSSLDPQGVYRFCDFDHAPCDDLHRICLLEESSNATVCGPCQKGHIEFETECVEIENLDYDAFVSSYKVVLSDAMKANQSLSERLESLREGSLFIAQHNLPEAQQEGLWKPPDFFLGLTPYSSDSTAEDYRSRSGYFYQNETQLEVFRHRNLQEEGSLLLPRTLDWVERGGVTHVKDQGRCGCCWAISWSGVLEGGIYADPSNDGYLQSLSFQQLLSCSKINDGCQGGNLALASFWSKLDSLEGIATLNEYPYTDYFGKTTTDCRTDVPVAAQVNIARRVGGFDANMSPQERILSFKKALQVQPVAVVMKSSCRILSNYRRGVITDDGECACQSPDCLDHAVLLVGYEDDAPIPYFRLKNSWGTLWGEDGYFNVAQSTIDSGSYGLFGILSEGVLLTGQNTTTMVEDEIQKSPLSKWWSILLLTLASLCSFVIIYGVARKHCF